MSGGTHLLRSAASFTPWGRTSEVNVAVVHAGVARQCSDIFFCLVRDVEAELVAVVLERDTRHPSTSQHGGHVR